MDCFVISFRVMTPAIMEFLIYQLNYRQKTTAGYIKEEPEKIYEQAAARRKNLGISQQNALED